MAAPNAPPDQPAKRPVGRPPKASLRVPALEVPDLRHGIAMRIRQRRQERGLSLEETAALCGISKTALGELEGGKRDPRCSTIYALAHALACPAGWLAFGG